jgi:hypothetical protein
MKSIYFEKDDILEIRVSDKPIVREVSQGCRQAPWKRWLT